MSLLETVIEVTTLLTEAQVDFLIGGSLASSVWGQERTTHDADIAVSLSESQLAVLERLIKWPYVIDSQSIRSRLGNLRPFDSGQILNGESLDKIDLFLLMVDPYSEAQMKRRRYIEVSPGCSLPFASPEDTVIAKLRWFVLGNRVSDRQWNDIVQVLEVQDGQLDVEYLSGWARHFDLEPLLDEALAQVERGP